MLGSSAVPPTFPAVRIDGEAYWDGGIYSDTPAEVVFDDYADTCPTSSVSAAIGEGDHASHRQPMPFLHRPTRLRHAIAFVPRGASGDGAPTTLAGCGDAVVLRHMRRLCLSRQNFASRHIVLCCLAQPKMHSIMVAWRQLLGLPVQ